MNNNYGPVYEIVGFSSLTDEDVKKFQDDFIKFFLKKGAVPGNLSKGSRLGVYVDRNSEYPDLELEHLKDGKLHVCDMDVHNASLLKHLRIFLNNFKDLQLVKILDAANNN